MMPGLGTCSESNKDNKVKHHKNELSLLFEARDRKSVV